MFKKLFNVLFTEEEVAPPSQNNISEFDPTQFMVPIMGYLIPQAIQKQLQSLQFPNLSFTTSIEDIRNRNKSKQETVILFPVRMPEITPKEFAKMLRDENPTLCTQLIVITDKFNKEELISLMRQRVNGILVVPLSKSMISTTFSHLNLLPESLKKTQNTGDAK